LASKKQRRKNDNKNYFLKTKKQFHNAFGLKQK
jgi:hypothetical protein